MNLRGLGVSLAIGGIALGIYVAIMALAGGCRPPRLPEEPSFVETIARPHDAG